MPEMNPGPTPPSSAQRPTLPRGCTLALTLFAALFFGFLGLMIATEQEENEATAPVEVHATVTKVSWQSKIRGGGGRKGFVKFRADDGTEGALERRGGPRDVRVGEHITVYLLGSGDYSWDADVYGDRTRSNALAIGAVIAAFAMVGVGVRAYIILGKQTRSSRRLPRSSGVDDR